MTGEMINRFFLKDFENDPLQSQLAFSYE